MKKNKNFTILLVDDDIQMLELTSRVLKKAGYRIFTAESGADCMKILHKEKPDILLLDVMLPDTNGKDICKIVKSDPAMASVFVILLSSLQISSDNVSEGLEDGADGYIRRPVESRELLARIDAACRILKAERSLEVSVRRWQTTFNGISDSVFLLDDKGIIMQTNKTASVLLNKTSDEILGHKCSEVVHGTKDHIEDCPFERMKKSKKRESVVLPIGEKWFEVTVDPLLNKKGILEGAVHFISDITDQKLAQDRIMADQVLLKVSETIFRELIELNPDGIILGSPDGIILSANSSLLKITGRNSNQLIGTGIESVFSDDDLKSHPLRFDLLKNGETVVTERNIYRPDGTTVVIEMHTKMMPDGKYQSIWHDITKRKLVAEKLRKSIEQYDSLVSKIPVGIYVLHSTPDGAFALDYLSPRMAEIFDTPVSKLLEDAKNIFNNMHPEDLGGFMKLNQDGIQNCLPFDWKGRIIVKNEIRWLHITSAPEPQQNGDVLWHGLVVDITDAKLAVDALIESERLLRESQSVARLGSFVWNLSTGGWSSSKILDEIFGIDEKYVRSFEGWEKIVHPEWRKVMTEYVRNEILQNLQEFDKEYKIIRQTDGKVCWVHGEGKLEMGFDNKPVKLIGTITDITKRKEVEEALDASEIHFKDVFESVTVGVAYASADGKVLALNRALEEILEIKREDIIGKRIVYIARKLLTGKNLKTVLPKIADLLQKKDLLPFQLEYKGKILEISTNSNEKSDRLIGIFRDVTDIYNSEASIKKKMEELEWLNKMMINREIKMIELKKEINEFLNKQGEKDKYVIHEKSE